MERGASVHARNVQSHDLLYAHYKEGTSGATDMSLDVAMRAARTRQAAEACMRLHAHRRTMFMTTQALPAPTGPSNNTR